MLLTPSHYTVTNIGNKMNKKISYDVEEDFLSVLLQLFFLKDPWASLFQSSFSHGLLLCAFQGNFQQ